MLYFTTMFVILIILSIIVFKFIFWRRIKDDFTSDHIFQVSFLALGLSLLLGLISYKYYPQMWFWSSYLGLILGILIGSKRNKMNLIELYEACIVSVMPVYAVLYIYLAVVARNAWILLLTMTTVVALLSFMLFSKYYKKFSWYRSGRIGFSGFSAGGVFFLSRSVVAYINPDMLSLSSLDVFMSVLVVLAHFAFVVKLSR